MNPQETDGADAVSAGRTPVPPPNLSAPALPSPDTTIAPLSSSAESVHGDITAPHVFQAKPAEVVSYNKLNPAGTQAPAPRMDVAAPTAPAAEPAQVPRQVQDTPPDAPAAAAATTPRRTGPAAPKKQTWLNNRLLLLAGLGLAIIIAIVFIWLRMAGSQAALATKFVASIQAGNATEAYSLTSTKFQEATDKSTFDDFTVKESYLLPHSKPEVVSRQVESVHGTNVATVALNIKAANGGTDYHAIIKMIDEGDRWVVFSADIKSGLYSEPLSTST